MTPNQIRKLRNDRNWSRQELADRLRVNYWTVVAWEQGKYTPSGPAMVLLEQLAGKG